MQLHDFPLSGNCYKVRLFLGLIGQRAEIVTVNLAAGEQKQPAFLALNPRGQVPVLVEDGQALVDSQAILVYLARRHAPDWLPDDALQQARIASWLSFAANELHHGPASARVIKLFRRPGDLEATQAKARQALDVVELQLGRHPWLAEGATPSIADVALYPYLAMAGEGGVELAPYPYIRQWCDRIRALPGYVELPRL
ncbi:glutathione S-transferase family protein [Pseudomonas tohonis]|uniref:glutathione S-transferase family protein n=1 Tax=Pseudomonas tohonis TaxID=2725477 RepID=UPI0021DA0F3B|nr:glutathione S-transferase family protein [Pseudomonas tohonis]UXY54569.1 glutathione S-transferase family protein [Pseudomonas tohonis]